MFDRLEGADRPAELISSLSVLNSRLQTPLGTADLLERQRYRCAPEHLTEHRFGRPFLAQDRLVAEADSREGEGRLLAGGIERIDVLNDQSGRVGWN